MSVVRPLALVLLAAACATGTTAAAAPVTPPIVFSADRAPSLSGEVYRLDSDGKLVDLSKSPFADTGPVVAPNGRSVAFQSNRGSGGVWLADIDGSELTQLATPPLGTGLDDRRIDLAWAPDSKRLALSSGTGRAAKLSVIGPGRTPLVLAPKLAFLPSWSPDGRLVTAFVGRGISAYRATGGLAWHATVSDFVFVPWSRRGLFLTVLHGRIRVLDERGRLRLLFPGRTAAWSADGTRLASVTRDRVEVRTTTGRVLLRKRVKGLAHRRTGMLWADARRVVVFVNRPLAVDVRTGRVTRVSNDYFGTRSYDGRFALATKKHGSEFEVRVVRLADRSAQTYGVVRGCFDDGVFGPAMQSQQFVPGRKSLVFESYCPEPPVDLYAVAADGSSLTKLTGDGKEYYGPRWSPDGTHMVYARADARDQSCKGCPASLWVANADGGSPRLLTTPTDSAYSDAGASWSPDATQLLFTRSYFDKASEVFAVPAAGGPARDLHISGSAAAWGPTRIAWVDIAAQPNSIWTALPDGGDRHKLAEAAGDDVFGALSWSHDGRLAYRRGHAGAVVIVSGGAQQEVQLPLTQIDSLAWSPDGTRFVIAGWRVGTTVPDVYTVRTDGTDLTRLTTDFDAVSADWR
jgi:Tol biopolymer transport system component